MEMRSLLPSRRFWGSKLYQQVCWLLSGAVIKHCDLGNLWKKVWPMVRGLGEKRESKREGRNEVGRERERERRREEGRKRRAVMTEEALQQAARAGE